MANGGEYPNRICLLLNSKDMLFDYLKNAINALTNDSGIPDVDSEEYIAPVSSFEEMEFSIHDDSESDHDNRIIVNISDE